MSFTPTSMLLKEGKKQEQVYVTGNTVIDALKYVLQKIEIDSNLKLKIKSKISAEYPLNEERRFILVTGHRRENFGQGFINICEALKTIAQKNPDIDIVRQNLTYISEGKDSDRRYTDEISKNDALNFLRIIRV